MQYPPPMSACFAADAGARPGGAHTFLVARDVRLDAIPRGRMNRLDPGATPWP